MNKIKVQDFINAYSAVLKLSPDTKNILTELMFKIIEKYEKIVPNIPVSMDSGTVYLIKPVDGKYQVEDFFLNRLMRNVWSVTEITPKTIEEGFADEHTKGQYDPGIKEVSFNTAKLDKQLANYKHFKSFDKMNNSARKKVVMHEFEHALQTRFTNVLHNDSTYRAIFEELMKLGKYQDILNDYSSLVQTNDRIEYLSTGARFSSSSKNSGLKTYRDVDGFDNLNEILNESESLEMASQGAYTIKSIGNDGNELLTSNPESSNEYITHYGDFFKHLIGGINTFVLMYLNPIQGFNYFNDKYNDIFQSEYNSSKDAIELFIIAITKIKQTKSEEEQLKLCSILAKCLQKKLNGFIDNSKISNAAMMNVIECFECFSIYNNDESKNQSLEHMQILANLKDRVNRRNVSTSQIGTIETEKTLAMPTFEEMKKLAMQYELSVGENEVDIVDRATNSVVMDSRIIENATFANLWLMAAGIKGIDINDKEIYAFNESAEELYNFLLRNIEQSLSITGNIDTIDLFKKAELSNYKHTQEIIVRLFSSPYQTKFLDEYFRKRFISQTKTLETQVLYNLEYVGSLLYPDEDFGSPKL